MRVDGNHIVIHTNATLSGVQWSEEKAKEIEQKISLWVLGHTQGTVQLFTQKTNIRDLITPCAALTTQYSILNTTSADCWGEIVAGCQVEICKGFTMGWMGRFKCLFTRQAEGLPANEYKAIYIPGFGRRDNIAWGLDYYIGVNF